MIAKVERTFIYTQGVFELRVPHEGRVVLSRADGPTSELLLTRAEVVAELAALRDLASAVIEEITLREKRGG